MNTKFHKLTGMQGSFLIAALLFLNGVATAQSVKTSPDAYIDPVAPKDQAAVQLPIDASPFANRVKQVTTKAFDSSGTEAKKGMTSLRLMPGQRLSNGLAAWLGQTGINLSWEASGSLPGRVRDIIIESEWQSADSNVENCLAAVLQPFGFEAQIINPTGSQNDIKTVVVRNAVNVRQ